MDKEIINYLLSNGGKLKENETWFSVGKKFGVKTPDPIRAKTDHKYYVKSVGTKTCDIWRTYLKQKEKLELTKEIYENGELKWETFKKTPEHAVENFDFTSMDVYAVTTNPYGGAWYKMKESAKSLFTTENIEKLRKIFREDIKPIDKKPDNIIKEQFGVFIYGSDKHIGAFTKNESIYKNNYDVDEIENRLVYNTLTEIYRWRDLYGNIDSLFIMDLGDALDGFNQKTTRGLKRQGSHTLPQQLSNTEQHDTYVRVHKMLFDIIVEENLANNIFFIATSNSNHGGDFEYGAMKNFETYLNLKYPFIKTYVTTKFFDHFIYGKHCIIFNHGGDTEDMRGILPVAIDHKTRSIIDNYIKINKLYDYIITVVGGDQHQAAETFTDTFRYRKVLSQLGNVKWGHTNFGFGFPGLSSEIIFKDKNDIYSFNRFFDFKNISNTGIDFK